MITITLFCFPHNSTSINIEIQCQIHCWFYGRLTCITAKQLKYAKFHQNPRMPLLVDSSFDVEVLTCLLQRACKVETGLNGLASVWTVFKLITPTRLKWHILIVTAVPQEWLYRSTELIGKKLEHEKWATRALLLSSNQSRLTESPGAYRRLICVGCIIFKWNLNLEWFSVNVWTIHKRWPPTTLMPIYRFIERRNYENNVFSFRVLDLH